MRAILLKEAMDRADREAYETILQTPDTELDGLWRDFLKRDAENGFAYLEKLGLLGDDPPEEEDWEEESLLPDLAVT